MQKIKCNVRITSLEDKKKTHTQTHKCSITKNWSP
uniref:Uncharacterized protein n=1 Tax=Anguilla anguilla TaxID=7936 RepID=A0A0E9Q277_ANGAN